MGDNAEDIYVSFRFNEKLKREPKYEEVIEKFNYHFGSKINMIYERVKFNQSEQIKEAGYSPAELLFGRKLRSTTPTLSKWNHLKKFHSKDKQIKDRQIFNYNTRQSKGASPT